MMAYVTYTTRQTLDVFCNPRMLSNIRVAKIHLILHCNAGTTAVTKMGDLKGFATIWYHPTSIANILSLNNMKKKMSNL